jgi:hypothetical protein
MLIGLSTLKEVDGFCRRLRQQVEMASWNAGSLAGLWLANAKTPAHPR